MQAAWDWITCLQVLHLRFRTCLLLLRTAVGRRFRGLDLVWRPSTPSELAQRQQGYFEIQHASFVNTVNAWICMTIKSKQGSSSLQPLRGLAVDRDIMSV